jgi:hypothetical protein
MSFCPACGKQQRDDARFCENCGTSLGPSPAPTSAPDAPAPGPSPQRGAEPPARPGTPFPLVPFAVVAGVLLVLFFGYSMFLAPMSVEAYEERVGELWDEIGEAQSDIYEVLSEYQYPEQDYDDEVDAQDLGDAREEAEDSLGVLRSRASQLRKLRPPKKYRDEHRDIAAGCEYLSGDFVEQTKRVFDDAEGQDYGEVADVVSAYMEETGEAEAMSDMYSGISDVLGWEGE